MFALRFSILLGERTCKEPLETRKAYILCVNFVFRTEDMPTEQTPGADTKSGRLFCSLCDDFIYDPAMEELYTRTVVSAEEKETHFQGMSVVTNPIF